MRVVQASFQRDPAGRSPDELVRAWPTLGSIRQAVQAAGIDATYVQLHHSEAVITCDGFQIHFTPSLERTVERLEPDLLHLHGLRFPLRTRSLCTHFHEVPVLVQDHGGGLPASWHAPLLRWGLGRVQGVAFTAHDQAHAYSRLLPGNVRIFEVLEASCDFTPGDRAEARRATGVFGSPALLWVGRLNANKDPLTLLTAVQRALETLPDLQLWCCYSSEEMLGEVTRLLAGAATLRRHVHLLGRVPHERVEQLCRAADLFVSASHAEGSGYALIEALACGATPVVTDIPSFRAITGRGAVGALVPVRNAAALAHAIVSQSRLDPALRRAAALRHFNERLTFGVIGAQLRRAYQELLS